MTDKSQKHGQRSGNPAAASSGGDDALAIELININKHFGPVHANKNIDLPIKSGTVHGIVGENGAGKTRRHRGSRDQIGDGASLEP